MRNFGSAIKVATALCLATSLLLSSSRYVLATTSNTVSISMIGKYDSADTAAIRSIDTDKQQIRLRNHATGKTYTLNYDNTSMMFDARGVVLSPQMLEAGQIVDVTFLKSAKHITTLNVSKDAWVIDSTKDHELVRNDGTARIGSDIYHIDTKTLVMADNEIAIAENILSTDKIKVSGIGKDIYSVVVTSGHGYVSLSSDTVDERSLVGAWLELDNEVIHKISPNMLLSAPEGEYNLQIIGNGANFQSEISISRNEETVVDTSEVTISRPKEGLVTFEIIPDTAEVYVDGEKMLTGVSQSIQYGYHNLKIMADGYVTQNRYLKIGTAKSVINIELEKKEDASSSSSSGVNVHNATVDNNSSAKSSLAVKHADANELIAKNSASAATTASTVSSNSSSSSSNKVIDGYYIYFDEPEYAELYFDGNYIGIIPTKIQKISGNHEVILKRSGYQTKSYRLKIDTATENVIYEFPDMEKEDDGKSTSSTSSSAAATSASSAASTASTSASTAASSTTSTSASTAASSAASKDASKDSSKEASTSASKEASKDASKDASKEASKDATKDASNNASKEATKEAAKDSTKETSNEASKDTTKEATAETTKEASSDTNKEVPSDTSTNNTTVPTTEKQEEGATTPQAEETPSNEASQTTESANDSSDVSNSANEASGEN